MEKDLIGNLEFNRIYQMDCLDGMKLIPNESVDMILCDLPYGTTKCKWDTVIPLGQLWDSYKRILKKDGVVALFAQTPFDKVLGASNLEMLKYEWVWEKDKPTGHLNAKYAPMKKHENILIFTNNPTSYTRTNNKTRYYIDDLLAPIDKTVRRHFKEESVYDKKSNTTTKQTQQGHPIDIIKFPVVKKPEHPTQKPVELCEWFIKRYTKENELVLDNCMGSGTTAIAALKAGRKFIGFELETKYIELAKKRIETLVAM